MLIKNQLNKYEKTREKKFEKKKENSRYIIFEDLVMKNLNVRISAKHYINDITLFSNIIENFLFKFKSFLKKRAIYERNK